MGFAVGGGKIDVVVEKEMLPIEGPKGFVIFFKEIGHGVGP